MIISREELLKDLELTTPGLSNKDIVEQSSCFVFKEGQIITFNDDVACRLKTKIDITGAVKADPLLSILKKLTEDTVELVESEGDDGHELIIKGKKKSCGIRMEQEIFLPIEAVETPEKWKALPSDFVEAVDMVKDCAGRDETQFALTCVHLHPDWIETSDTYQVARYTIKTGLKQSVLVRKESLKFITTLGMTEFSETKNWIHFRNSLGLILSCRRYIEEFRDMTDIFKIAGGTKTTLPRGLKEASEKAEIFSSDNIGDNLIKIHMKTGKVKVEGRGSTGWFSEIKNTDYEGKNLVFMISPALLIQIIDKHHACIISTDKLKVETDKFQYVTCLGVPE